MDLSFADLKKLSDLLKVEDSSDSEDDLPRTGLMKFGPGHIGLSGKKKTEQTAEDTAKAEQESGAKVKDIWDSSEISEGIVYDESEDVREKPEFEIKYKQSVSAEDIFLSSGLKTPGSASCEDMVVDILLPNEDKRKVDIEIAKQVLELRSPKYRLSLPLPHPVKPDFERVFWDSDKLVVTLRMERELDFANF